MIQAYNFLASWQLFPEKGTYERGERPRSGFYKIGSEDDKKTVLVQHSWVNLDGQAYESNFTVIANAELQPFSDKSFADEVQAVFPDTITFELHFYKGGRVAVHVIHTIMPNGYMQVTQQGFNENGEPFTNTEIYYKQMSVLPYAASVAGAVVRPTEEGVIRHKALTAMEEQTNMQLDQIRRQIELLALQAREIYERKELSSTIYNARIGFQPVIGQTYHLYQRKDESHILSLISPKEWGGGAGPFSKFIASVKLLADHTWVEVI